MSVSPRKKKLGEGQPFFSPPVIQGNRLYLICSIYVRTLMGFSFTCNIYHKLLCKRKAGWRAPAMYVQQKCLCALFTQSFSLKFSLEKLCQEDSNEVWGQSLPNQEKGLRTLHMVINVNAQASREEYHYLQLCAIKQRSTSWPQSYPGCAK